MEISTLQSYIEQICLLNGESSKQASFLPYEYLFRGHSDTNYTLLPTIARRRNMPCDVTIFNGERNLVELAKCKYPDVFQERMKPVEILALLQHYGIPTRLLDVTENALVALYFACCSNPEKDGEVFVFVNKDDHVDNAPIINAIADSYRLTRGAPYRLENFYQAALNQQYFIEHKHIFEIIGENFNGPEWIEECCKRVIFVYSPIHTLRQQLQQGRFILFPNRIINNYLGKDVKAFDTIIDPINKDNECIKTRFIIKKESKSIILKDLQLCGISESTLFSDSIDIVSRGIVDKVKRMLSCHFRWLKL